jgi:hypothetical protein
MFNWGVNNKLGERRLATIDECFFEWTDFKSDWSTACLLSIEDDWTAMNVYFKKKKYEFFFLRLFSYFL